MAHAWPRRLEWSAAHEPELNASERAFLDASRTASERSQRRLRAVLAGVAVLLVLAVIAGVVALEQRGSAREQAVAADAQRLGARALVEDDLDRALLLARQGVALDDSVQTRGNLLAALLKSPAALGHTARRRRAHHGHRAEPDERTLAAGTNTNKIFLFDTRTRRRLATLEPDSGACVAANWHSARTAPTRPSAMPSAPGAAVAVFDLRLRLVVARRTAGRPGSSAGWSTRPTGATLEVIFAQGRLAQPRVGGARALRRTNGRSAVRSRAHQPCRYPVADDHERRAPLGGRRGG